MNYGEILKEKRMEYDMNVDLNIYIYLNFNSFVMYV